MTFPLNSMLSKRSQRGAKIQAIQRLTKQADHSNNDTADGTVDDDTTVTTEDAAQQSTETLTATPRTTTPGIDHTKTGVVKSVTPGKKIRGRPIKKKVTLVSITPAMTNTVASLNLNTPCNNHAQNSSAATNHGISFQKTTTAMSTATISKGNNVSEMKTIGGVEGGQESFNNKHLNKKPRGRPRQKALHTTTAISLKKEKEAKKLLLKTIASEKDRPQNR